MEFLDKIYQKNPTVVTRKIGDKIVLIPTQQHGSEPENVISLNDMAAGIWVQIDGNTPLKTIKERILEKFAVTLEQAERDLTDFVLQLEKSELIFRGGA